jgi:N-formylglutamate amidohydrolase
MGVMHTRTGAGRALREPPCEAERATLIERHYYRSHHDRLTEAVTASLGRWRWCLVIDCHSFPARPLRYGLDQRIDRPETCIGTGDFHTPERLWRAAERLLENEGFRVAIDRPFAGALVPLPHYRENRSVLAIMIEVNRSLYMCETSGEKRTDFDQQATRIQRLLEGITLETRSHRNDVDEDASPGGE